MHIKLHTHVMWCDGESMINIITSVTNQFNIILNNKLLSQQQQDAVSLDGVRIDVNVMLYICLVILMSCLLVEFKLWFD